MHIRNILFALLVLVTFSACNADRSEEKSSIEKTTDKVAEEAVEAITQPIEKAEMVKELSEEHNQKIKESVE